MKKQLSTSMTFFYKYIFPTVWLTGFGLGSIMVVFSEGIEGLPFLFGFFIGFFIFYYTSFRAKEVHIDDEFLYVSNFRRSIQIPLRKVKAVSEIYFWSPTLIFVEFSESTDFGKKIMFIAYFQMFPTYPHPARKEIEQRI